MDKEQYLQLYRKNDAEIKEISKKQKILAKEIVELYCPYKVGDKIEYIEGYMRATIKHGIITSIKFSDDSEKAIDGMWAISVKQTTKEFQKIKGRINVSRLGEIFTGDKIIKIS